MTDYDLLYSKFQLSTKDAEYLNELHKFANNFFGNTERVVVTTTITDSTGTKTLKQEVQDAKLVWSPNWIKSDG